MNNSVTRVNKRCSSYPCHEGLEDCTFCFCPLYPCLDEARGKYVFSKKQNKVWSCSKCNWIHQKKIVDDIFQSIMDKESALSEVRYFKGQEDTGVVILAHGSKVDSTRETLHQVIEALKKNLKLKYIMPAYLQLCPPTLSEVTKALVGKGCRKIIIVPYFLFNGNHVVRDIPSAIERERDRYPETDLICTRPLSEDERTMSSIVANRIKEAI